MNSLTDAFDVALQVREGVVDQIFRAMHRAGPVQHTYARAYAGKHVTLQIASPDVTFVTAAGPDQRARALATSRVYYHARDLADARDPGTGAVADVTIRATLWLTSGDPAPVTPDTELAAEWIETARNDITVHAASAAVEDEVKDALLSFIRDQNRRFPLPALGSGSTTVGSIAFRFLPGAAGPAPILTVGMNVGNVVKGQKAGLQQVFVQQEWALALSDTFVLQSIRDGLLQRLGSLPPPNGPAPVTISDRTVCTFPTPFGCADHSRQRVFLDTFDVALESGRIVFSGGVRVATDAWYVPDVSATFRAEATLAVGANQTLSVSVSPPTVSVQGWFADVIDFLSSNALEDAVRDGVQSALQSGVAQGGLTSLFSTDTLTQLASLGSTASLQITPTATSVEIRSEAILIHGTVAVQNPSAAPSAAFVVLPGTSPTRRILHAGQSWAPGGRLTQFRWDFGDQHSETTLGDNVRFVAEHDYAPGVYRACLTVTDNLGRTAQTCRTMRVRDLTLRHTPEGGGAPTSEWEVCEKSGPFTAEFQVRDGPMPMPDALVRAFSPYGWEVNGFTNANGKVTLPLEPQHFTTLVGGTYFPSVRVEASKSGYYRALEDLEMVDCAARQQRVGNLKDFLGELLELLPVPIEGIGGPVPPIPPTDGDPFDTSDPLDPRAAELMADLILTVNVLTKVVQLADRRHGAEVIATLLGIDPRADHPSGAISDRLTTLYASTLERAGELRAIVSGRNRDTGQPDDPVADRGTPPE